MQKFINKLIGRLEEAKFPITDLKIGVVVNGLQQTDDAVLFNKAIEVIKELAEQYNNGWIPCEEKYPDTNDYILISFSNFSIPVVGRYEEDKDGGAFYVGDEDVSCVAQDLFVNAWQPLPPAYKEGDK